MKRVSIIIVLSIIAALTFSSCEKFLDKSPDLGLSESDVYKDYNSFRGFLDNAYNYRENFLKYNGCNNGRVHQDVITDELMCNYNSTEARTVNSGNWNTNTINADAAANSYEIGNNSNNGGTTIYKSYTGLRIVNRAIRDIDKVPGITGGQRDELLGQAYFLRAWFYFQLIIRYGGMPKFDKLFTGDGTEDLPRMTYLESHDWMMTDIEKAIDMLPTAWDADNTGRPDKVAAMAFKSEATLYACSPLMQNGLETTEVLPYNKERAKEAAKAADELITFINEHPELGFGLTPGDQYSNIFYWTAPPYRQMEHLWYNRSQSSPGNTWNKNEAFTRTIRSMWQPGDMSNGTGNDAIAYCAPTQNAVDMFEKKGADGFYYPITDPASGYDQAEMFKDRDPRLSRYILIPGERWGVNDKGKSMYITTYKNGYHWNESYQGSSTKQRQLSGYFCKKYMWEEANQYSQQYGLYRCIIPYIRLAEIYLNYAEASFEATGSATETVEGCSLSAVECLNVIRQRVGVTDVAPSIWQDPESFREAYRRERNVELMFECKRWWDMRRWMIAHEVFAEQYPIKGLVATPVESNHASIEDKSTLHFTYETVDLVPEVRVFGMRNYWYPFAMVDVAALSNLNQNPMW